jgi:hypothetical protein
MILVRILAIELRLGQSVLGGDSVCWFSWTLNLQRFKEEEPATRLGQSASTLRLSGFELFLRAR